MRISPELPVLLFAQIANELRYRIASGALASGVQLPSARDAAQEWGVNFHTVRRAYRELARWGLVHIDGPRGTRVVGDVPARRADRAHASGGLTARPADRAVTVVECNAGQAEELAAQVVAAFDVQAVPYVLGLHDGVPRGAVLGTLFHRAEMLDRWPALRPAMRFLAIRPDLGALCRVGLPDVADGPATPVVEWERGTANGIVADLTRVLGTSAGAFRPLIIRKGHRIPRGAMRAPVLVAPRVWDSLPADQRESPRAVRVAYRFDPFRLGVLGESQGWVVREDAPAPSRCPVGAA